MRRRRPCPTPSPAGSRARRRLSSGPRRRGPRHPPVDAARSRQTGWSRPPRGPPRRCRSFPTGSSLGPAPRRPRRGLPRPVRPGEASTASDRPNAMSRCLGPMPRPRRRARTPARRATATRRGWPGRAKWSAPGPTSCRRGRTSPGGPPAPASRAAPRAAAERLASRAPPRRPRGPPAAGRPTAPARVAAGGRAAPGWTAPRGRRVADLRSAAPSPGTRRRLAPPSAPDGGT